MSTHGKGRTFYWSLGHPEEIYCNPAILKHYLAGIQYVLGDLDADATLKIETQGGTGQSQRIQVWPMKTIW